MRAFLGAMLIMTAAIGSATDATLLDQDFRKLASDEVVNLEDT